MQVLIQILVALTAFVAALLAVMNVFVMAMTFLHRRHDAMRWLYPFSRAIEMLRMSDSYNTSKPYRHFKSPPKR